MNDIIKEANHVKGEWSGAEYPYYLGRVVERTRDVLTAMSDEIKRLQEIVDPLNELRAEDGSVVIICSDDPEGPPTSMIGVRFGEWTENTKRHFQGATLAEALAAAVEAKRERTKGGA